MTKSGDHEVPRSSRREFIKASAVAVSGTVASRLGFVPAVHAAGSDEIRVGVIGCGGRGTGAAVDAAAAAPGVKIVALADAFKDRLDKSREELKKEIGDKLAVSDDNCFVGFDAYEKVLASDVNYVHPCHPARLPAHAPEGGGGGGQAHLRGEARGRGRSRRAHMPGGFRRGEQERAGNRCRDASTATAPAHRETVKRHARGRHRGDRIRSRLFQYRFALVPRSASRDGRTWNGRCATGTTSPGCPATTSSSSTSTTSTW